MPPHAPPMPTAFVAHGAPLLALDDAKAAELRRWADSLPRPRAVLVVSAHWEQAPAAVGPTRSVPLIYDFQGFPPELYAMTYPAPVAPELAERVARLLAPVGGAERHDRRGLDHGAWVPLRCLYPAADVPVLQLSLPTLEPRRLFALGRALAPLRDEAVLLLGSGNLTHNLRRVDWRPDPEVPGWAREFDEWCSRTLAARDVDALLGYRERAPQVDAALPTHEHFAPLLVAAGAADLAGTSVSFPITGFEFGSLSRRSVQFG